MVLDIWAHSMSYRPGGQKDLRERVGAGLAGRRGRPNESLEMKQVAFFSASFTSVSISAGIKYVLPGS